MPVKTRPPKSRPAKSRSAPTRGGATGAVADADIARLRALADDNRWRHARALSSALLKRAPDNINLQVLAARVALFGENNAPRARKMLEAALAHAPDHLGALTILSGVVESLGEVEAAADIARRRLALNPGAGAAYYALMRTAPAEATALGPAMEALAFEPTLSVQDRASLYAAIGDIRHKAKDYDGAFTAYSASKRAFARPYDTADAEQRARCLTRVFSPEFLEARAGHGLDDRRMIFIVGLPRSGTTLVERVLAAHPDVASCGERPELSQNVMEMLDDVLGSRGGSAFMTETIEAASRSQVRRAARRYLEDVRPTLRRPTAKRWIDKMPANLEFCGFIGLLFPNAKIIVTKRDPRDVALSSLRRVFTDGHGYTESFDRFIHHYMVQNEHARYWTATLGDQVLEVAYEDLVADLEGVGRRMVSHVGLAWDPACAAPHEHKATFLTASAAVARKEVFQSSVGGWRRYEAHMAGLNQTLAAYEKTLTD